MRVLLLTPRPNLFTQALKSTGDDYEVCMDPPDKWPEDVDFIVSFGYRHIIREPYLTEYEGRLVNIHMSMLPWNRGADPNFWSWFDHTPKGVSMHFVDSGIDTGNIIMQMEVSKWKPGETLHSSYEFLSMCAGQIFALEWDRLRVGNYFILHPDGEGSFHKSADKDPWMAKLRWGWGTPVEEVERLGEHRGKVN